MGWVGCFTLPARADLPLQAGQERALFGHVERHRHQRVGKRQDGGTGR